MFQLLVYQNEKIQPRELGGMEPYIGQIEIFAFDYAPRGWMSCAGQQLIIRQYQGLFALIGTTYGGDGVTNFNLPDLRGVSPVNCGVATNLTSDYPQGTRVGSEMVTITSATLPTHIHTIVAYTTPADIASGDSNYFAEPVISAASQVPQKLYANVVRSSLIPLNSNVVSTVGGGGSHDNMQPYLTVNYCIAVSGIFPSRE